MDCRNFEARENGGLDQSDPLKARLLCRGMARGNDSNVARIKLNVWQHDFKNIIYILRSRGAKPLGK